MNRRSRLLGGRRLLVGVGGFALTAGLAVFHGGLLLQRLTDGSLLQPVVVVRWLVSALLVFALFRMWSKGLPVVRGRRAGVIWMVVILLHAFTPGGWLPAVEPVAEGMLPAALAMLALLAFGLGVERDGGEIASRKTTSRLWQRLRRYGAGWYRVLFSRPPPVSLHP
jgi:hypothetical protein